MILPVVLFAAVAVQAQFPAPTTHEYIAWLISGDSALAGAPQSCINALQTYSNTVLSCWDRPDTQTCFCALDTNAITSATSVNCAGGSVFPWMQNTYNLRAQCSAPPQPVVVDPTPVVLPPPPPPAPQTTDAVVVVPEPTTTSSTTTTTTTVEATTAVATSVSSKANSSSVNATVATSSKSSAASYILDISLGLVLLAGL
ncbi:hypothetical protein HDU79_005947 [Rhizoclosmatium sp. JEL0117]|nr:hypothetical protein HDU79_005947 [Rhizoclosmatium sp. JEL0117]